MNRNSDLHFQFHDDDLLKNKSITLILSMISISLCLQALLFLDFRLSFLLSILRFIEVDQCFLFVSIEDRER